MKKEVKKLVSLMDEQRKLWKQISELKDKLKSELKEDLIFTSKGIEYSAQIIMVEIKKAKKDALEICEKEFPMLIKKSINMPMANALDRKEQKKLFTYETQKRLIVKSK